MEEQERDTNVTVVARNNQWEMLEVLAYAAFLWYITHPEQAEELKDNLHRWKDQLLHRISVWQTRAAIQSLPETDPDV